MRVSIPPSDKRFFFHPTNFFANLSTMKKHMKAGVHLHKIELAKKHIHYKLHSSSIVVANYLLVEKEKRTLLNKMKI